VAFDFIPPADWH